MKRTENAVPAAGRGAKPSKAAWLVGLALALSLLLPAEDAQSHSVAQVQTTKFFTPETVQMLKDRAVAGTPGLQVGDTVSYIIQFTPVENASNAPTGQSIWGTNGYITDYIPSGTEVVGAWIVAKDGSGNFVQIPPSYPGGIDNGWGTMATYGDTGQQVYLSPFNVNTYDPTGRCAAGGFTNRCNGRLTAHVADTGIFYSTDPRTAQYPPLPTRILQGTNGYNINPTGAGQLNPIIGQSNATVHNLWDADQTNAFGTGTLPASPRSSQGILMTTGCGAPTIPCIGFGVPPFYVGSPVAGPQTGYPFDCTGSTGPWNRIAYSGSRIADISTGPSTSNGSCLTCVNGTFSSTGWNLSPGSPLPAGTNAVRWAIGKLTVGETRYVKISLRLTSPIPAGGLINGSEVYGGDTAESDDGAHNTWRYMVPSVADNNSNLYVVKSIACVYSGGVCTTASNGDFVTANAKIRYRIVYLNAGNATQANVNLTDTLPCQTAANSVSNISILSGPIGLPSPNPPVISAGTNGTTCTSAGRRTFAFPQAANLGPGEGGALEFDVQTNAAANSIIPNTATLYSSATPSVTSNVNSSVQTQADLLIGKTASAATVASGGTVTYTITVQNSGTANATNINVYDLLPTSGGTTTADRFSFIAGSSSFGGPITPVTPTRTTPPTLTPYNTGANQEQVRWNFGAQTLAPGASFTITFGVTAGANVPASATPYYNTAAALYTYTGSVGTPRIDAVNVAGVTIASTLTAAKSIECYYSGASCIAYNGAIPANAKVRYRVDYANTGAGTVANAVLSDTLPCQTATAPVSYNGTANTVNIVSGPITTISAATLSSIASGSCGAGTRRTFSFPAATIGPGQSGLIKYDVQTNATITTGAVTNTVTLGSAATTTVTSEVQTTVEAVRALTITKTASATSLYSGQSLTYTLTIASTGTATATNLLVYDWLPTSSPTLSAPTRFSFVNGSSVYAGIASATTTSTIPPTQAPYSSGTNAANQQEVAWNFGASTLAPGASFSITYGATVGSAVTPSTYYANNARVLSGGTSTVSADSNALSVYVLSAATPTADVAVTKSNSGVFLTSGGTTTYTITVANSGPSAANTTVVRDAAVSGLAKTGIACTANGLASCPTGTWLSVSALEGGTGIILPTFASGGQVVLTVPATVTAAGGVYVTNTATAAVPTGVTDSNWSNNSASDTDLVMLMPQFTVLKSSVTASDPVNGTSNPKAIPGAVMTYSLTVTNNGTGTADSNSIFLADPVPANMTALAGSAALQPGGDPNITGITVTYTNVPYNAVTHPASSTFCSGPNAYMPPVSGPDANIAGICIAPTGQLSANGGAFTVKYGLQIN